MHPIQGTGSEDMASKIQNILRNAERGVLDVLVDYYDNLVDSTTEQLQRIVADLNDRSSTDKEEIDSFTHWAELSEDSLKSALEKTRTEKLRKLKSASSTRPTPRKRLWSKPKKIEWPRSLQDHRARNRQQPHPFLVCFYVVIVYILHCKNIIVHKFTH